MNYRQLWLTTAIMLCTTVCGQTKTEIPSFLSKDEAPNALLYVPAPPSLTSPEYLNDVYYYQWGKLQRNDSVVAAQAASDELARLSIVFSGTVGFTISPEATPEIYKLAEGVKKEAEGVNGKIKKHYQRKRPFVQFNEPTLVAQYDSIAAFSYSYPSGHATRGWAYAMALAAVVPDSTGALMARARQYAVNRLICGRHYKSDIDASLMVSSALFARLLSSEAFQQQLAKARREYAEMRKE